MDFTQFSTAVVQPRTIINSAYYCDHVGCTNKDYKDYCQTLAVHQKMTSCFSRTEHQHTVHDTLSPNCVLMCWSLLNQKTVHLKMVVNSYVLKRLHGMKELTRCCMGFLSLRSTLHDTFTCSPRTSCHEPLHNHIRSEHGKPRPPKEIWRNSKPCHTDLKSPQCTHIRPTWPPATSLMLAEA